MAPVHVLVVPKLHIESLEHLNNENEHVLKDIHFAIQRVAKICGVEKDGYRVIINCGKDGGQTVPHLHYHVIGGLKLTEKMI